LRTTALPTARPIERPSRACARSLGEENSTTPDPIFFIFAAYTASNSRSCVNRSRAGNVRRGSAPGTEDDGREVKGIRKQARIQRRATQQQDRGSHQTQSKEKAPKPLTTQNSPL
jgi:hypothetical protein